MRDLILLLVRLQNSPGDPDDLTGEVRELIAKKYPQLITAPESAQVGDRPFTVYWRDGTRQVINGPSIEEAYKRAGYGAGAVAAIDWYANGDVDTHDWVAETKSWMPKNPVINPLT